MKIELNGQQQELKDNLEIGQLLEQLNLQIDRVVLELNHNILNASENISTALCEGDKLEVIEFVGGG